MAKSTRGTKENVLTMPRLASRTQKLSQPADLSSTDIATRAFELYCERGRQDGHDVEDWLQAESELQRKANSTRRRGPQRQAAIAAAAAARAGIEATDATA